VFLDLGAKLDGYYSDLSRTVVVGDPDSQQLQFLRAGESMFQIWLDHAGPGVNVADLRERCRQTAVAAGFDAEYMPLGYGHGLGTSLFELPYLSGSQVLREGMTFALEPMLVKLGSGTAVVEDTMLVTASGVEARSGQPTRIYL